MKILSAHFPALVLQTISTVQVPQKHRPHFCQKTPHCKALSGLEEIRKHFVAPRILPSYTELPLPV